MVMECVGDIKYASAPASLKFCCTHTSAQSSVINSHLLIWRDSEYQYLKRGPGKVEADLLPLGTSEGVFVTREKSCVSVFLNRKTYGETN